MEPTIAENTSVRVVEKVSSRVITNRTIIQKTSNTNAVHVNRYDADGNLKSSEVDTESWEDRDTRRYEWSNADEPPAEALEPPPTDERFEAFFAAAGPDQQPAAVGDGRQPEALVLTKSERRDVPAVCWSGENFDERKDECGQGEHRTAVKMEGSQWSRSGESVWISSTAAGLGGGGELPVTPVPLKAVENGRQASPLSAAAAVNGSVSPEIADSAVSVEERRRRRCMENKARRATDAPAAAGRTRERQRQPQLVGQ